MVKIVIGTKIAVLIFLVIISVSYEQDALEYPSPCPHIYMYEPPETEPDLWSGVVLISTDSLLYFLWLNIVLDRPVLQLRTPVGKVVTKNNMDLRIESDVRIFPGRPIPLRFSIKYDPSNGIPKLKAIRLNGKVICKDDTLEMTSIKSAKIMEQTTVLTTTSTANPNINTDFGPNNFMSFENGPIETLKFNKSFLELTGNLNLPWTQSFGNQQVGGFLTTTQRNPWTTMKSNKHEIEDYRGYPVEESYGGGSSINYNPQGSYIQLAQPGVVEPPCGTPSPQSQWPWRAAIYQIKGVNYFYACGGALISHRHVITTSNCVRASMKNNTTHPFLIVYLGKQNHLLTSTEGEQRRSVKGILLHPGYSETESIQKDDLAILELSEPVKYTESVRRVCLWPRQSVELENVVGKTGWLTGWGHTPAYKVTEDSHSVELTVVSHETCSWSNPTVLKLIPNEMTNKFCAGNKAGSVCLAANNGNGLYFKLGQRWHLRGAVGFGLRSKDPAKKTLVCDSSQYFIFTDYAKYLPWIRLFTYDL